MKFKHNFTLTDKSKNSLSFKEADNNIQIDFFKHIMRVAMYKDGARLLPTFTICPGTSRMPDMGRERLSCDGFEKTEIKVSEIHSQNSDEKDTISISTEDANISIELFNFRMKVETPEGKLLYQDRDYISYNWDHELGKGSQHFISRESDEQIFGLGDKTGDVNKNHRCFKMATSDSMGFDARYSDPLYKQIPFYICKNSAGAYGIYYDTYSNGTMDFGVEHNNYYIPYKAARFDEDTLVFYVIFGTVPEILNRFEYMCGQNMFAPKWSLKYCGSTMNYTDAPDADNQLRNYIKLCNKYGFKPGGFYLSSGYTQIGEKRYVFNWNTDKIPSPENLSAFFKENGVEFLPNIKPAFLTDHFLYNEIAEKGWFLHYKDGTPAIFPFWSGYGSYLDFTNKDAFNFWTDCVRKQLVEKGYKNIWNDNNEYDVCDEEVYADGWGTPIQANRIRPLFSYLMTEASLAAQDKSERTFAVTRSGIAGLQRSAMTWTGDNNTSFDDLRYNHKMAMTMSLSGLYNFGQDIGGFAGPTPSKELFLRWIQYGIFTPRFVLHSWNADGSSTMPWLYEDKIPTVKKLFDLREKLIPYLYNQMYKSHVSYNPVIYPVFLKYPDYDVESDIFFFGDDIIACPIFDKGAESIKIRLPRPHTENKSTSEVQNNTCACGLYIPNGTNEQIEQWYFGNSIYSAGDTIDLPCSPDDLPVYFTKAGSVIPTQAEDGVTEFIIYAMKFGTFDSEYFSDDGKTPLSENKFEIINFHVECKADAVNVSTNSKEPLRIKLIDSRKRTLNIK